MEELLRMKYYSVKWQTDMRWRNITPKFHQNTFFYLPRRCSLKSSQNRSRGCRPWLVDVITWPTVIGNLSFLFAMNFQIVLCTTSESKCLFKILFSTSKMKFDASMHSRINGHSFPPCESYSGWGEDSILTEHRNSDVYKVPYRNLAWIYRSLGLVMLLNDVVSTTLDHPLSSKK